MTDISTNQSGNAVMKADTPDDLNRLIYLIKLCWRSLKLPSRLLLLGVIGLVLVTSYGVTLAPLLFAHFIDALSLDIGFTVGAGVLIAGFLIAYWLSYLGREVLWITAGPIQQRIQRRANAAFFAQAMALPFDEHLRTSIGGLSERLVQAQNGLNQIIFSALVDLLPTVVLTLFILLNSLLFLPGYVFVILSVTIIIYLTALVIGAERVRRHQRAAQKELVAARELLGDAFLGIEAVKAFGQEVEVATRYEARLQGAENRFRRFLFVRFWLGAAQVTIATFGMAIALGFGISQIASGDLSIGTLVLIQMYFVQTIAPLQGLSLHYRNIKSGLTMLDGVAELFGEDNLEPQLLGDPVASGPVMPQATSSCSKGTAKLIQMTHVSVRRNGRTLLDDVSLYIDRGETIAFVGPTGSGKSTVVRLLLRLLAPDTGTISVDGQDSDAVPLDQWRTRITLVPQDIVLFTDTIAANLRFGAKAASDDDLERVLGMCSLDGLVSRVPDGLQTHIGNRGQMLSGGERQRIGIARAVLRNPDVIVLDEATSALDRTTEREVLDDLHRLMPDVTKIIVTHRMEAVRAADRIYVFEAGQIVEAGNHTALSKGQGLYRALVDGERLQPDPDSSRNRSR